VAIYYIAYLNCNVLYLKYYNLLKRLQQGSPTWCPRAPGRPRAKA